MPAADITKWASKDGQFRRQASVFRDKIQVGGKFPPEEGRYTLYVSLACPWAHRTLIVRKLKGLERFIDVVTVHPIMLSQGWSFYPPKRDEDGTIQQSQTEAGPDDGIAGVDRDPMYDAHFLRELYFKVDPNYEGRFTVPTLWDKKTEQIVNNESAEIIRFLNTEFNSLLDDEHAKIDLYPESGRAEIDDQADWVYNTVNNGVYKVRLSLSLSLSFVRCLLLPSLTFALLVTVRSVALRRPRRPTSPTWAPSLRASSASTSSSPTASMSPAPTPSPRPTSGCTRPLCVILRPDRRCRGRELTSSTSCRSASTRKSSRSLSSSSLHRLTPRRV